MNERFIGDRKKTKILSIREDFKKKYWNLLLLGLDDANAWRKSTKEANNTQNFLLQFRKYELASSRHKLKPKI